jgi:hypothetical protein
MFFVHCILLYGPPGDIEYPKLLKIKGLSDVLWEYTKKVPLIPAPSFQSLYFCGKFYL